MIVAVHGKSDLILCSYHHRFTYLQNCNSSQQNYRNAIMGTKCWSK